MKIDLKDKEPFAKGGNRICYINPLNKNRCLKIVHPGLLENIKKDKPWFKKLRSNQSFDDNLREEAAYSQKALSNKNDEIWKHLAKWYGMVETNIGLASDTELILNNGEIAETLEEYLFREGLTSEIQESINIFHTWLRKYLVLTKNLIPHNLVLQKNNNEITIKIIDGLGSHSFIPLPEYFTFFAKQYVERRIELMWSRIHWDLSGRKGSWK
tara:strand:+ start:11304 stop:11942 length:639 start_codon:yes stop_codon:yes gene_type:complete